MRAEGANARCSRPCCPLPFPPPPRKPICCLPLSWVDGTRSPLTWCKLVDKRDPETERFLAQGAHPAAEQGGTLGVMKRV